MWESSRNLACIYQELIHIGAGAFGAAVLVRRRRDGRRFVAKKCCIEQLDEKQVAFSLLKPGVFSY